PVKIDPKPLADLGNVKFLGTVIADTHPVVRSWGVGSPARVPLDSMITAQGTYDPQAEMRLDATYPVLAGYKGHVAGGWHVQFQDPMLFNQLSVDLSFSPAGNIRSGEQLHGDISYSTLFWHLRAWHNDADFYDLFGPTDRSRRGDAFIAD